MVYDYPHSSLFVIEPETNHCPWQEVCRLNSFEAVGSSFLLWTMVHLFTNPLYSIEVYFIENPSGNESVSTTAVTFSLS